MLRWYFGPGGAEDQGPEDSITRTFKGNKYYSLAREVIQNSLDAVLDESAPVTVSFSLFELNKADLPGLDELGTTIDRCKDFYAEKPHFVKFCNKALATLSAEKITCLRIGDFNTRGLEYGEGKSNFYAFMKAVGYTNKTTGTAGGSFGFGKGAYYAASLLRTLLVSSVYSLVGSEERFIFQGKARLTTHMSDGQQKDCIGLFGDSAMDPVEDQSLVPRELVRTKRGTDVIIVGFDDDGDKWRDSLIKSVLNNFWMAIWREQLIVEIEDIRIDKPTLENSIQGYFNESDLDGTASDPEGWNPYPYFKAVKYEGGPNNRVFDSVLPTLGAVKMWVHLKEGLPDRTVYMRKPMMTVFKRTNHRATNYVGVFECANKEGNRILREMENPEHNEWKATNYLDGEHPHPEAVRADDELRSFVRECLEELQQQNITETQKILGLDRFLTIPEDLLADEEGSGTDGTSGTSTTSDITNEETAVETSRKVNEPTKIVLQSKNATLLEEGTGTVGEGEDTAYSGETGDGEGNGNGFAGDIPGIHPLPAKPDGEDLVRKLLKIRYRVVAQGGGGIPVSHLVKLFSEKPAKADVEFFSGVDNDGPSGDDSLVITAASLGDSVLPANGNRIRDVALITGENLISVTFDSGQKHALRIKSYEI